MKKLLRRVSQHWKGLKKSEKWCFYNMANTCRRFHQKKSFTGSACHFVENDFWDILQIATCCCFGVFSQNLRRGASRIDWNGHGSCGSRQLGATLPRQSAWNCRTALWVKLPRHFEIAATIWVELPRQFGWNCRGSLKLPRQIHPNCRTGERGNFISPIV